MRSIPSLVHAALWLVVPLSLSAPAGCGSVDTGSGGTSTGTGGGASTSSGTSTSTGTGTGGMNGGCSKDHPCPQGDACVFGAGSCQESVLGACVSVIQCDGPATGPVCGCDGKTIEGEYAGCGSSQRFDTPAACQTGTFACGPMLQCKRNSEVCVAKVPGAPGPTSYACQAFATTTMPGWCTDGIPFCECIDLSTFGPAGSVTCKADADNQETVTVTVP